MQPIEHTVLLALVAIACTAPVAVADGRPGGDRAARVVPAFRLAGDTGGQLLGDWFVQNLSLPASERPVPRPLPICASDLGHRGKVLSPSGGLFSAPRA